MAQGLLSPSLTLSLTVWGLALPCGCGGCWAGGGRSPFGPNILNFLRPIFVSSHFNMFGGMPLPTIENPFAGRNSNLFAKTQEISNNLFGTILQKNPIPPSPFSDSLFVCVQQCISLCDLYTRSQGRFIRQGCLSFALASFC